MSISSVDSEPLRVKPEVDMNLTTEANRVLYVMNKIIWRAKLVGLLEEFSKNEGEILRDILNCNSHFEFLNEYNKYRVSALNVVSSPVNSTASTQNSLKSTDQIKDDDAATDDEDTANSFSSFLSSESEELDNKKYRKNNGFIEVLFMLEENPKVRKMVDTMGKHLSPEMKFFVRSLTEFKNRMEVRLHENAAQFKAREKYMREVFEKNEEAKKEIERLEEELLVTKTDANVCLIGRNILIKRHQNKIEQIQQNSQEAIEKIVNESEKAMVNSWKSSMATQEHLKKDFLQVSEKCANSLRDHLAAEKILRSKRSKVENQVLGWIQKFDQDIGEKQAEEEEIQALLDKETTEVNEIQSKLDEQQEEYDELMQEKAQYDEEMLDRRLYQFIVNRSARRIQRTYRMYKARKLAKKLAKKGKKGKKKGKN